MGCNISIIACHGLLYIACIQLQTEYIAIYQGRNLVSSRVPR